MVSGPFNNRNSIILFDNEWFFIIIGLQAIKFISNKKMYVIIFMNIAVNHISTSYFVPYLVFYLCNVQFFPGLLVELFMRTNYVYTFVKLAPEVKG